MSLDEALRALRRHWRSIAATAAIGALLAFGIAHALPERFRAQTSVVLIPTMGSTPAELAQGATYVQSLVETSLVLARSPAVLEVAIEDVGLDESPARLAGRVDVESPLTTAVVEIGVEDAQPARAAAIANAIAAAFADAVVDIVPTTADGKPAVAVSVIEPATAPAFASFPNTRLAGALGGVGGLAAGALLALLRTRRFDRLATGDDVQSAACVPVLGVVPAPARHSLEAEPHGRVAESLRSIAAAIAATADARPRILLLAGVDATSDAAPVSLGIASALADSGRRVLLVDASDAGVDDVMPATAARIVLPRDARGVRTIAHVRTVIAEADAGEAIDDVLIATGGVLDASDAVWLAPAAHDVIVVVRARAVRGAALQLALQRLRDARVDVLGVVLEEHDARGRAR